MVTIIIILPLIVLVLGFTTYNLLKKNERCEDMINSYENYMKNLSGTIDFTNKKLKEIDAKGSFESDDEIGFFFKEVKILQEMLNDFNIK
tara:strand:- start:3136 stop:3405 length:270 start_codon:yes stop_codon:yes gene_type:complete